ncbi:hypothetical protein BDV18DRAFT_144797 [Aspergillus unguis]
MANPCCLLNFSFLELTKSTIHIPTSDALFIFFLFLIASLHRGLLILRLSRHLRRLFLSNFLATTNHLCQMDAALIGLPRVISPISLMMMQRACTS